MAAALPQRDVDMLLFALASVAFASSASMRIVDPMLPRLALDFARTPAEAASTITAFALAYGVMQLVFGPIGDRYGKLRVISWAALAATVGSLLCAAAPTLPLLNAARFATGACCAALIPLSLAWLGDAVAYERLQETLARFATGTLLGLLAGQALGGIAADTIGWRSAFVVLALLFAGFGLRLRAAARASAPFAAPPGPDSGAVDAARRALRGYVSVAASRWSQFVFATAFLEGALLFGAVAFIPTWLHLRFGLALSAAGLMVATMGIGGLMYTSTARHWIVWLGERRLAATGGATIAVGIVVLLLSEVLALSGTWLGMTVVTGCITTGFGFNMLHNTLQTLATQLAPHARGTAVGLFAASLFIGQAIGVIGVAAVAVRAGYPTTIGAAGLLVALLGLAVATALGYRRRREG